MTNANDFRAKNLALWEGLAALHGSGLQGYDYYDLDALVAGRNPIQAEVDAALDIALGGRALAGLDVLHVQSHIGIDSIELARRGAHVTCTDFSPTALQRAGEIAARAGVELALVEADSTDLPASLHGQFDLAYATIGVIVWIADIDAWMRSVAACLRPGGRLVLVDIHPLRQMADSLDPLVIDMSYTFEPGGLAFDEDGSYADETAKLPATQGTAFSHSLGEVVTAAVDAGLVVRHLREFTEVTFDANNEDLVADEHGIFRWQIGDSKPLPLQFGLVASRD